MIDNGKPGEACGVVGIHAPGSQVAGLLHLALYALQHRGQESAGISVSNGEVVATHKDMGLVSAVFDETTIGALPGSIGIGHTRYSTTGSSTQYNAQPATRAVGDRSLALAHNGNLTNTTNLSIELGPGIGSSDSELMLTAIGRQIEKDHNITLAEAVSAAVADFQGAYTMAITDETAVVAVRDPHGFRPLALGRIGDHGWVVASETAALDVLGATFERDVEPGEMVVLSADGMTSSFPLDPEPSRLCIFEYVYFARTDSVLAGQSVREARLRMGWQLAAEAPVEADVVVPIPESGILAARGYASISGIHYADGLVKNRYVGRTFIEPEQATRDTGVKLKLNPVKTVIEGRRVVLVDDSVIRGSTTRNLIQLVRSAGATEVHLRVSSPPYRWPCFYGMDTSDRTSLLAADRTIDEIAEFLGVDSLGYLSVDGLQLALPDSTQSRCTACLTGDYPTPIGEHKFVLERP